MDIERAIARELGVRLPQVANTVSLLDEGNTVPFIARYRKEATGELDEIQVRAIQERLEYLRALEARKETVLKSIADQGKLTPELEDAIQRATVRQEVEDLYLPYRPKRRTRATVARERGLEPLAELILAQEIVRGSLEQYARPFLSDEVPTIEDAYAGARDIVAEIVAEDASARRLARERTLRLGILTGSLDKEEADPHHKYSDYYEYRERFSQVQPHRLLALNRGEREGALRVRLEAPVEELLSALKERYLVNQRSLFADQALLAVQDAYKRLIAPAIERELRAARSEQAEEAAIEVFGANLRSLLLSPPVRGRVVIGIDPGFRTGCKVALVDATSRFLTGLTIYPHPPQRRWEHAKEALTQAIAHYGVQVVAIGNGTASRETESLVAEVIAAFSERSLSEKVGYTMVNEAGASVYSASDVARAELPAMDVSMRGAVSIARRLQDPLAELVKIDPRSIGVGLYQHDVNQRRLGQTLDGVVESVVNYVGVDLNTASASLLGYVSGINARTAVNVVAHRDEKGRFASREALLAVKGLGPKAYEQAAGFLRIPGGEQPLDNTAIHPESYAVVDRLLAWLAVPEDQADPHLMPSDLRRRLARLLRDPYLARAAQTLDVGLPTLRDILDSLLKPGRDPRDELPPPILRSDVLKMEDLSEGMVLQGTVRNVVPFGAFVDIGVKQDGLVHVSQMADHYVQDPLDVVQVGDVVEVRVLNVDPERGRIGLTMKA
jgi:uncharacterized protein